MNRKIIFSLLLAFVVCSSCGNPPPAKNFSVRGYLGTWYELAKYQTIGGGIFQHGCKCTKINITLDNSNTIHAEQSCLQYGRNTSVDAVLIPDGINGKFQQKISFNRVGYWVIWLDQMNAIEYDCKTNSLGQTNYCIHLMSRKPQASPETIKKLSDYALSLGLNANNLDMQITDHQGCWSTF